MSHISSLKVDKLSDLIERILKKTKRINATSIIDEYIGMVDISRKAANTNDVPLPTHGKRTLTYAWSKKNTFKKSITHFKPLSSSHGHWKVTDVDQLETENRSGYNHIDSDEENDYCYHLMQNNNSDTNNIDHGQSSQQ